jgi:hypothetical protein
MNHAPLRIFAMALVSFLPLAGLAETSGDAATGLEGVISLSPSHGGPITKDRPSVAPAGNVEFVVKKEDTAVATFTTDAEGAFRISLPPGHYVVAREGPGTRIGHWRFEADVVAGKMTKVQWTADSGMR